MSGVSVTIQPGLIYLTRKDWGARTDIPRLGHSVNRLDRTEAIMHHTVIVDNDATPNRWETMAEVFAKMRQLQTIRPDLGLDVPYNFVAFHMADGSLVICEGRGLDRTGAHTHDHNTRGIATAGEGNFQIGQTVAPYADHWSRWWGWLKYGEGMENLGRSHPTRGIAYGHRDFIATGCPGDKLYAIIPQLTFKEDDMEMDWETFVEWSHRFIREVPAQPRDEKGNPIPNARHPIGEYLGNIRDISARERAHDEDTAKHGGGGYSDAQAVKAVKDKL